MRLSALVDRIIASLSAPSSIDFYESVPTTSDFWSGQYPCVAWWTASVSEEANSRSPSSLLFSGFWLTESFQLQLASIHLWIVVDFLLGVGGVVHARRRTISCPTARQRVAWQVPPIAIRIEPRISAEAHEADTLSVSCWRPANDGIARALLSSLFLFCFLIRRQRSRCEM